MASQVAPHQSVGFIEGLIVTKCSTVAALAYVLYDILLTLDVEIAYVWSRRWSFGKVLFLTTRYPTLIKLTIDIILLFESSRSNKLCQSFSNWQEISTAVVITWTEVTLQCRVYAVYHNRKLSLLAFISFILALATSIILLFVPDALDPYSKATPKQPLDAAACWSFEGQGDFSAWMPPLIFDFALCLLILRKMWMMSRQGSGNAVVMLITRDSALYLLTVCSAMVVNVLFWAIDTDKPSTLVNVAASWPVAMSCTCGSRLLLNVREEYFKTEDQTEGRLESLSSMDF